MQTTKLSQSERIAFVAALKKMGLDSADSVMGELEDTDYTGDGETPIRMRDLPTAIPLAVRKQIVVISKTQFESQKQLDAIFNNLYDVAEDVLSDMEDEKEAALVHCESCGHVLAKQPKQPKPASKAYVPVPKKRSAKKSVAKVPRYGAGQMGM